MEIQIDSKLTEEYFMEHCLNLKASGYDPTILIGFYAIAKRWHVDKFLYLRELLNEEDEK